MIVQLKNGKATEKISWFIILLKETILNGELNNFLYF
jgi:hypothetical protein